MLGSLEFLTPWAGLLASARRCLPIAALALGARSRAARARSVLGSARVAAAHSLARLAVVSSSCCSRSAATQPVVRRSSSQASRADAAVFVVVDTSNSMAAAHRARAPSRLAQAKRVALAVGVGAAGGSRSASRPSPTGSSPIFSRAPTVRSSTRPCARSPAIPPPRESSRVATTSRGVARDPARRASSRPAAATARAARDHATARAPRSTPAPSRARARHRGTRARASSCASGAPGIACNAANGRPAAATGADTAAAPARRGAARQPRPEDTSRPRAARRNMRRRCGPLGPGADDGSGSGRTTRTLARSSRSPASCRC